MGSEDIKKREDLITRMHSSGLFSSTFLKDRNLGYFLQYNPAERVQACVEGIIPEGTELFHSTQRIDDIIATGQFGTRLEAGLYGVSETGTRSNLLHFGEAGKINGHYGDDIVGVPIETIVAKAPYLQQENGYEVGNGQLSSPNGTYSQHLGKVELPTAGEDVALVVRQRAAKVKARFEKGILAQGTNGGANNLTFAASEEPKTAGAYSFDLKGCSITHIGNDEQSPFLRIMQGTLGRNGYDEEWPSTHVRRVSPNNPHFREGTHNAMGLYQPDGNYSSDGTELTDLILPTPNGIKDDKIVGFAPISTKVLGWSDRNMVTGGGVEFTKKETQQQSMIRGLEEGKHKEDEAFQWKFAAEAAAAGLTEDELSRQIGERMKDAVF